MATFGERMNVIDSLMKAVGTWDADSSLDSLFNSLLLRLVDDEAGVMRRTARSLGEFVALLAAKAFARRPGTGGDVDRLEAEARGRIRKR